MPPPSSSSSSTKKGPAKRCTFVCLALTSVLVFGVVSLAWLHLHSLRGAPTDHTSNNLRWRDTLPQQPIPRHQVGSRVGCDESTTIGSTAADDGRRRPRKAGTLAAPLIPPAFPNTTATPTTTTGSRFEPHPPHPPPAVPPALPPGYGDWAVVLPVKDKAWQLKRALRAMEAQTTKPLRVFISLEPDATSHVVQYLRDDYRGSLDIVQMQHPHTHAEVQSKQMKIKLHWWWAMHAAWARSVYMCVWRLAFIFFFSCLLSSVSC